MPPVTRERDGSGMDEESRFSQVVSEELYVFFRARVRETFMDQGWTCIDSDDEADFLVRSRWELYAAPADGIGGRDTHEVVVWEFPTEESRRSWDARVEEEADKAKIHYVPSAEAALELLRQVDPEVVRGS